MHNKTLKSTHTRTIPSFKTEIGSASVVRDIPKAGVNVFHGDVRLVESLSGVFADKPSTVVVCASTKNILDPLQGVVGVVMRKHNVVVRVTVLFD